MVKIMQTTFKSINVIMIIATGIIPLLPISDDKKELIIIIVNAINAVKEIIKLFESM